VSRLTVKSRGRTEAPDQRRGRILSCSARGAKPHAHHGPLQRLLAGSPLAFPPQARIACRMQHCRHDDMRFREDVEHAERKPLYKRAAELAAHKTKRHWIGFDAAERRVHFFTNLAPRPSCCSSYQSFEAAKSASASARTISVRVTQCAQAEHGPPATGIPASDPFQKRQGADLAPALELGKVQAVQGLQRCCPRSPPPSEGAPPPARRSRQLPRCVSWPECSRAQPCTLTVKLRGRAQAPGWSRGWTLSSPTRGDTTDSHGPSNDC